MISVRGGPSIRRLLAALARNQRLLQAGYLLAALVYAGVVVYWGRHDMSRMHREYRQVSSRLTGDYAVLTAGREVAVGCLQTVGGEAGAGYGECLRRAEALVPLRAAVIGRELQREKRQLVKKLAIFYSLLSLVLILLPVALFYGVLATLFLLCAGIRFENNQPD